MARGFAPDSLGPPSLVTWLHWFHTVLQSLLGHGLSILIGLVVVAFFWKAVIRSETNLDSLQKAALSACTCAGLPIVLAQLTGTNHLLRHISPAVIPLAIAMGILSDRAGWLHSKAAIAASSVLLCGQLILIVYPAFFPNTQAVDSGLVNGRLPWRVMFRRDQWDWRPVQDIAQRCGVPAPAISFLGYADGYSPPQIQFPWALKGASTNHAVLDFPDVTWLWRYDEGPINWQKVMDSAGRSDIVLTAPHCSGDMNDDLNNQHNAEFVDRLSRDPDFQAPIRLQMGRFEPVEVDVFVKKSLTCGRGQGASISQLPK